MSQRVLLTQNVALIKQTVVGGVIVGLFNVTLLSVFRHQIALLFTQDPEVIKLVAQTLPVCATMQLFDGMAAVSHGLLRGIGRQEIGGYVNLLAYYVVALPISFGLGFGLGWNLVGLWMGVTFGLLLFVYPSSSLCLEQTSTDLVDFAGRR